MWQSLLSNHIFQALLAGLGTWGLTALGAGLVFFINSNSKRSTVLMLGFAAGIMLAAAFWSLLSPAIEMSKHLGKFSWFPAAFGFVAGAVFLRGLDLVTPHLHYFAKVQDGPKSKLKKSTLLVLAVTLHNIPEGLAVGVAFGAVAAGVPEATLAGAITLSLGIGLQNFPEGAAVSLPLQAEGFSKKQAFFIGQASGLVEPVAAVFGAMAVTYMQAVLPYALAFAAGAMVFVVVEEVIPESQAAKHSDMATMALIFGFTIMMILDVAFG